MHRTLSIIRSKTANPVKDSPEFESIRAEYEQLWADMQEADAEKVSRMLERGRRELMPPGRRLLETLKPLRTHLLWAVPLGAAAAVAASYAAFILLALWVE
ncbi:hypothetical protein [Saccharibacillus alkalitolerans]|uniref:SMODS and SLOG-associating 2TM effector domain-containing protein n=1 Tax=Saccharibacillus alkalitolerans TaxID=2705290 RepID=A0ABX0F3F0_9BACL|nr:hypothetical protein [Saccharibacillus alkalitolerans]NGZ75005.1 hypothetical protein [Saccharibacillus alkalitolerans]